MSCPHYSLGWRTARIYALHRAIPLLLWPLSQLVYYRTLLWKGPSRHQHSFSISTPFDPRVWKPPAGLYFPVYRKSEISSSCYTRTSDLLRTSNMTASGANELINPTPLPAGAPKTMLKSPAFVLQSRPRGWPNSPSHLNHFLTKIRSFQGRMLTRMQAHVV